LYAPRSCINLYDRSLRNDVHNFESFSLHHVWLTVMEYLSHDHGYVSLVVSTSRSFPHSWLITGFVTRLTRRVPLLELELLTLLEHLSSPSVLSGVRVTRSLVLCVCFVDRCLSFFFWLLCCLFFFDIRIPITPLVSSNSSCQVIFIGELRSIYRTPVYSKHNFFPKMSVKTGFNVYALFEYVILS
jgi:hypothetical protein